MDESKYKKTNEYNKDHYFKLAIRIPKSKRDALDELSQKLGKSINSLFIEAVEAQYGIDITASNKATRMMTLTSRDSILQKKLKMLDELQVPKLEAIRKYLDNHTSDISDPVEYCDRVSILVNYILNCYYDGTLESVIDS